MHFFQIPGVILDVCSPAKYTQGHIPGAVSFPLFNNEERALVGTCYKQKGKDEAVELGLGIAGPKLANFVARAKILAPERQVRIYCWRGGMRSASVGCLLETAGFNVVLLMGGYKGFRRWALWYLNFPQPATRNRVSEFACVSPSYFQIVFGRIILSSGVGLRRKF